MGKLQAQQMGGTLRDFLRELLRKLETFEEGRLALQRKVVEELLDRERGGPVVQRVVGRFADQKIVRIVQDFWHPRFRKHLDLEPPQESILCAFTEIQDNAVNQAGLAAFLQWVAQQAQAGYNPQTAVNTAANPQVAEKVRDLNEAVAAIIRFRSRPPAGKTTVISHQLRTDIRQAVNTLIPQGFVRKCLGGAPAIISDVLAQLGMQRVHLYSMYHSDVVTALYRGQPQRLDLNVNPPQLVCVNQPGEYVVGGNPYPHPTRSSDIFTYNKGHTITVGNQSFTASQDDRVVFRVYRYIGNPGRGWKQVQVKLLQRGHTTPWLTGPTVDDDEWPAPFGFVRWEVNNGVLEIEYLGEPGVRQIRDYDYIILNAPGLATFQRTDPLGYMEAESLRQQLEWIARGPARVHLEISGEADPFKDRIQPFARNVKGLVHSVGINDGELKQITALPDYAPPITGTAGSSAIYQRYERALRLAQALDVERLYVHGNDVDLVLRKGGSPGDMRAEIQADLFAKGIVVLAVLQRSIGNWHGYLQADYAIAIARGMIDKAEKRLKEESRTGRLPSEEEKEGLTNAKKALEAAEGELREERFDEAERRAKDAQEIVEQTFRVPKEPGPATVSLSPVLLAKSFKTLIEFAYDYVRFSLGGNEPSSLSGLTREGEEIFQRIVETGYYVTRDPGGYSVAVVPVMWPELPVELNPTGAGDICSGVTAVFSGF